MRKTILNPQATRILVPRLSQTRSPNLWVYRYEHTSGWRLSIATHAEPGSQKLSLGGFRIAPEERTTAPGFDSDVEAIELAMGMEEKVYWSRTIGVGGPLAKRDMKRIVGGKCVLHPTADARVGKPRDRELLDFAIACLNDCERDAGILITTGQDLGHGTMSDGKTSSLEYLNRGFAGSVLADTSQPTGEGNFYVLCGMLSAVDIRIEDARVALVGGGNIGMHVLKKLRERKSKAFVLEMRAERRKEIERMGHETFSPQQRDEFLERPMDALVLNASGGSLDSAAVRACSVNAALRVICGSENLVMPNPDDAAVLLKACKVYCTTELGGMMGYLTAVEEYLAHLERIPFDVSTLLKAATELEGPAHLATKYVVDNDFRVSFEAAVEVLHSAQ